MNLIRGDTLNLKFKRIDRNGEVIKEKPEKLFFTVKNSYYDKDYLFQKSLEKGTISYDENDNYYRFTIEPEDTNNLIFGKYVYDIEVVNLDIVKTIAKGTLEIEEEVTFAENEV